MPETNINEQIKAALLAGKVKEEIYKDFLALGYSVEQIQAGFEHKDGAEDKEESQKKTVKILFGIGVLLVGAGIFSFIASNWQDMSKLTKILIILVSMVVSYVAGWNLKEVKGYPKTGSALYTLANIIYGSGIFLVAQMYNIRSSWADGFILWMLGALAAAYLLDESGLYFIAVATGIVAVVGQPFVIMDSFEGVILTSSILLLAACVATFLAARKVRSKMPPELKNYF